MSFGAEFWTSTISVFALKDEIVKIDITQMLEFFWMHYMHRFTELWANERGMFTPVICQQIGDLLYVLTDAVVTCQEGCNKMTGV